jgi:hypothetical protein
VIRRHKVSAANPNAADPAGTAVLTVPQPLMTDPANIPGSKVVWVKAIVTHQDMIDKFGTLPFVAPVKVGGDTVFVQESP